MYFSKKNKKPDLQRTWVKTHFENMLLNKLRITPQAFMPRRSTPHSSQKPNNKQCMRHATDEVLQTYKMWFMNVKHHSVIKEQIVYFSVCVKSAEAFVGWSLNCDFHSYFCHDQQWFHFVVIEPSHVVQTTKSLICRRMPSSYAIQREIHLKISIKSKCLK